MKSWVGPLVTFSILGAVAMVIALNVEWSATGGTAIPTPSDGNLETTTPQVTQATAPGESPAAAGFREYPIGEEQEANHLRVAAVWLPAVHMEGMAAAADPEVIHLEADIRATEQNPNGFARDEFVPYLAVTYKIVPAAGGAPIDSGPLVPMVANDGLHYGASIHAPPPGEYKLTYHVEPPSRNGLGRHDDPVTGVAPWWAPFDVSFDWDVEAPSPVDR